ncbi:MAG: amidohydrolase family protein, partial [Clostridia bacterium]|nr:amidohydrolase family protein [Clostridia bacterium]
VGFRNLLKAGWPLETVSRMASRNPARIIGIGDRTGTIETGKDADLQLLSPSFEPVAVWVGGRMVRL